jgi:ribose-phosphate pyrophosphokinase
MKVVCPSFLDIYPPNVEIKKFPDGDSYVRVEGAKEAEGKDVVIFNRFYPNQDSAIFQTILAIRAIREHNPRSVRLVAPYLPYSRQDKTFREGEAKSAEILCDLLRREGVDELITFDCHFLKREGEFEYGGLKIRNISMNGEIVEEARALAGEEIVIMSPDEGASYLVKEFGGSSMKKERGEYVEGKVAYRKIEKVEMEGDVKGKSVLIIDDMISTGGTMLKAVENVKKGGAKKIICAATHGFFLKGSLEKLRESGEVFVTDTIQTEVSGISIRPAIEKALGQIE